VICSGGAAGGVHALQIARELGIKKVFIPKYAPIYCAYGMLGVDLKHDFTRYYTIPGDHLDLERVKKLYQEMEEEGLAVLAKEGIAEENRELVRTMNVQYFGQFRGLEVEWPSGPITEESIAEGLRNFHKEHKARYGHSDENYPYMFTSWGLSAIGKITPVSVRAVEKGAADASDAVKAKRQAYFEEALIETTIYDGDKLKAGNIMEGPCIIEERMTNIVVPPGSTASVDEYGNYTATDQ
jgi:N-methylhydantoinase A